MQTINNTSTKNVPKKEYLFLRNPEDKILDKEKVQVVAYHEGCYDGFGSAFIVWLWFKQNFGLEHANNITYVPCNFVKEGEKIPEKILEKIKDKHVVMCDFSYKSENMFEFINASKSFMILDHHKSAKEELAKIPSCLKIFDMKRSGVGLTWDYFFKNENEENEDENEENEDENKDKNQKLPLFLSYIQDRDLWRNKLKDCDAFVSFFYEQKFDFELWEKFLDDDSVKNIIEKGKNWEEYKNILVERATGKASYVIQKINNKFVIVLYVNSMEFKSDIGSRVFSRFSFADFSSIWHYDLYRNNTYMSLRSTDERMDVSLVAKKFGGGGHRNAAGVCFNKLVACLPFDIIDDYGLLELIVKKETGMIKMLEKNIECTQGEYEEYREQILGSDYLNSIKQKQNIPYTLFRVGEIKKQWLESDYFNLLKRKCSDSMYIIFQEPSGQIEYDNVEGTVHKLHKYTIFFNDSVVQNMEKRLALNMSELSNEYAITFTSKKEFADIEFSELVSNEMNFNDDSDQE